MNGAAVKTFLVWYGKSRKAIGTEVAAILGWYGAIYVPTGHVDRYGWFLLLGAVVSGFGIYAIPNDALPPDPAPTKAAAK